MFGKLFGSKETNPNLDRIAGSVRTLVGLELILPPTEVREVIDSLTARELLNFNNVHSVEGMQELFRAKSLRAAVDVGALTVTLTLAVGQDLEQEIKQEHAQRKVIHFTSHRTAQPIIKPPAPVEPVKAAPTAMPLAAAPVAPLPPAFEHLEALELLFPQLVDLFLKHGRLNSGDKEVLKNIRPPDNQLVSRIATLERWQAEMTRRMRGLRVPKAAAQLFLGTASVVAEAKPEEELARRLETIVAWTSKLIKTFEHTGVKFHNKPMWLPT